MKYLILLVVFAVIVGATPREIQCKYPTVFAGFVTFVVLLVKKIYEMPKKE